jgi:16S rRNA (uracil1498-N3)-methyltransferase
MHIPRLLLDSDQYLCTSSDSTPAALHVEATFELTAGQAQHLTKVLRREDGAIVEVLLRETNQLAVTTLKRTARGGVQLTVTELLPTLSPFPRVAMIHGASKPKALESIIQHCSETGVSAFHLFPAEHSARKDEPNTRRLGIIRDSAVEQARLGHVPTLASYPSLNQLLKTLPFSSPHKLVCTSPAEAALVGPQPPTFIEFLQRLGGLLKKSHSPLEEHDENVEIYIAVGPEGGFSSVELEEFAENGFQRVTLGPYVARAESAALIAAGLCRLAVGS